MFVACCCSSMFVVCYVSLFVVCCCSLVLRFVGIRGCFSCILLDAVVDCWLFVVVGLLLLFVAVVGLVVCC